MKLIKYLIVSYFLVIIPIGGNSQIQISSELKPLSQLQQEFLDLRFGMFICLNTSTYNGDGWTNPKYGMERFKPKKLDCSQWAKAAKSAGMRYACLTTKHHDGFCIWPTNTTEYCINNSPVKTDVVREFVDAFRKEGLNIVLYFSMIDFNAGIQSNVIKKKHIKLIKDQLSELLSNYGKVDMLLIDGWNASWSRIDYEEISFKEIYDHVKSLQPNCLISEHNAQYYPQEGLFYTDIKHFEQQSGQNIDLNNTVPSQSGPCLQSKWFWLDKFPEETLKPTDQIINEWLIPFNDAHANLLLNVAINPDGLIDKNALDALKEIGEKWQHPGPVKPIPDYQVQIISENLAAERPVFSNVFSRTKGPDLAVDNNFNTYFESYEEANEVFIEVHLNEETLINKVVFTEMIGSKKYGDQSRIKSYSIQCEIDNKWKEVAVGNSVHKVQKADFKNCNTEKVRLVLYCKEQGVQISEFGVYNEALKR